MIIIVMFKMIFLAKLILIAKAIIVSVLLKILNNIMKLTLITHVIFVKMIIPKNQIFFYIYVTLTDKLFVIFVLIITINVPFKQTYELLKNNLFYIFILFFINFCVLCGFSLLFFLLIFALFILTYSLTPASLLKTFSQFFIIFRIIK